MIFVTIGTQEPFDRMIKAIDDILPSLNNVEVVAQVAKSNYKAKNFKSYEFLSPKEYEKLIDESELILSHAGMGTIISALVKNKPILVMPRLVKYGEHRNEHQLSTARQFEQLGYINVAYNEEQLIEKLIAQQTIPLKSMFSINESASAELINSLADFIKS
jgi:UDP-N-acetylglucosamine transferase subunit ALG13